MLRAPTLGRSNGAWTDDSSEESSARKQKGGRPP